MTRAEKNQARATATAAATRDTHKGRPSRVRERIVQTAGELFYRQGIRAVGVDAIAAEAGTNKMSFYRHFASKDALVAEYLRDKQQHAWDWWDAITAQHAGDPRRQIEALFDSHVSRTCADSSRGCPLANAAVEITDADHPARVVVESYKAEMRARLHALADALGAADAAALGDGLMLLMEGSYLTRLSFKCHSGPAAQAAQAARTLMDAHAGSAVKSASRAEKPSGRTSVRRRHAPTGAT